MKKKVKLIYLLAALITVCGCKKPYYAYSINECDMNNLEEITVNGTEMGFNFEYPIWQTIMTDSLLIVQVLDPDGFVNIYDKDSLKLIKTICQRGRARNEFSEPFHLLSQNYYKFNELIIMAVDKDSYIKEINVTRSIAEGRTVLANINDCPSYEYNNRFLFLDNDITKFFVYKPNEEIDKKRKKNEYVVVDTKTNTIKKINAFPKPMMSDVESVSNYSSGVIYKHPSKNVFVQPCEYMHYLLFFDLAKDTAYASHIAGTPTFDDYAPDGRSIVFARAGTVTNDFIFSIHATLDDKGKDMDDDHVLVFDWDGHLLYNIKLQPNVLNLMYDEFSNELYGISLHPDSNGNRNLYKYDLSSIIG